LPALVFAIMAAACAAVVALSPPTVIPLSDERNPLESVARQGTRISPERAAELEARLIDFPDDERARAMLIGYYGTKHGDRAATAVAKGPHALWFIENRPELRTLGHARLNGHTDPTAYPVGTELWKGHRKSRPGDLNVLANMANHCRFGATELQIEVLEEGMSLDPTSAFWPGNLGEALLTQAERLDMKNRYSRGPGSSSAALESKSRALRDRALELFATAIALEKNRIRLRNWTSGAAEAAFLAKRYDVARPRARRVLLNEVLSVLEAPNFRSIRFHEDAHDLHDAHTFLGVIALAEGDAATAGNHLLASAANEGSPVMRSFGPNMRLAKALLEAGEREPVLKYFERCGEFWRMDRGLLAEWTKIVEAGEVPSDRDFYWRNAVER